MKEYFAPARQPDAFPTPAALPRRQHPDAAPVSERHRRQAAEKGKQDGKGDAADDGTTTERRTATATQTVAAASEKTYEGPTPVVSSFAFRPLTTTWTRPKSCSGVYTGNVYMVDEDPSCLPKDFEPVPTLFYSPGIACPKDYTTACHDTAGVESITTVICCPKVADNLPLTCPQIPWPNRRGWSSYFCTFIGLTDNAPAVLATLSPNGVTSTVSVTFSYPEGLNAYGIRMVYQDGDLEKYAPTTIKDDNEKDTSSTRRSSTGGAGNSDDGSSDKSSTGLSTNGPKDPHSSAPGIGDSNGSGGVSVTTIAVSASVGAAVLVALIALVFFFLRRRRKNAAGQQPLASDSPTAPTADANFSSLSSGAAGYTAGSHMQTNTNSSGNSSALHRDTNGFGGVAAAGAAAGVAMHQQQNPYQMSQHTQDTQLAAPPPGPNAFMHQQQQFRDGMRSQSGPFTAQNSHSAPSSDPGTQPNGGVHEIGGPQRAHYAAELPGQH